jgi:O-methyltransferase involved in polyketide biosynthesis
VALRTAMFDRYVRPFVERHPAGTVVEIGAGLNTRFERLDTGTIHWVDLDLPDGAALRRRYFQETDRRTILGCSILDPAWVDTVRQCPPPYCFVAETVLVYLQEAEVRTALGMISADFPGSRLVFDTLGPRAVRHGNQDHARQQLAGRFRWGCADPHALETWGSGLRLVESGALADVPLEIRPSLPLSMRVIIQLIRLRPAWRNVYRINVFETAPAG